MISQKEWVLLGGTLGTFLSRHFSNSKYFSVVVWLLILSTLTPPTFLRASDETRKGNVDEPVVLQLQGSLAEGQPVTIEMTETETEAQGARAIALAQEAVRSAGEKDGKTFVLVSDATDAPKADLQKLAEQIGDANPKGSEVIVAAAEDVDPALEQIQKAEHAKSRIVLTIFRVVGIAGAVATVVYLQKGVPFFYALPTVGAVAAAMSGALQWINGGFQQWLISRGLFRIDPPGSPHAPHYVTFGKLFLTSVAYLGVFRTALYAFGFEHAPAYFSWANVVEVLISATVGATLEYAWDRLISESLTGKLSRDPKNRYRHLKVADTQAAAVSVVGTFAETLSASMTGFGIHKLAAGVVAVSGVVTYVWVCKTPSFLKKITTGFVGGVCKLTRRILGND